MLKRFLLLALLLISLGVGASFADDSQKTVSVKGKIFRSDTKEPIANALILLLDEKKSDKHDNSVEARTDEQEIICSKKSCRANTLSPNGRGIHVKKMHRANC